MKTCRENLDKLKNLCEELSDRDEQLKINASTLWAILERVDEVKENLSTINTTSDKNKKHISESIDKLAEITELVSERGCKRVVEDE